MSAAGTCVRGPGSSPEILMGPAREPVQVDPRRLRDPPDGCSLPGLTGFGGSHRAGLEPAVAPACRAIPRQRLVVEPLDAIASAAGCQRDAQPRGIGPGDAVRSAARLMLARAGSWAPLRFAWRGSKSARRAADCVASPLSSRWLRA